MTIIETGKDEIDKVTLCEAIWCTAMHYEVRQGLVCDYNRN